MPQPKSRKRIRELLAVAVFFGLACLFSEGWNFLLHFLIVSGAVLVATLAVLACRGVLILIHESGHALMARLLGWGVSSIVVGIGPVIGSFRVGRTSFEIRRWPISGFTQPEPASLRWMRLKYVLILLAGPLLELTLFPLLIWACNSMTTPRPEYVVWPACVWILSIMVLYDVVMSLVPWTFRTVEGDIKNDARLMLNAIFAPQYVGLPAKPFSGCVDGTSYPTEAFLFIREGLSQASQPSQRSGLPTHVDSQRLCRVLRDLAIEKFGAEAQETLARWGVTTNRDFGRIVFAMADSGWIGKGSKDSLDDFTEDVVFESHLDTTPPASSTGEPSRTAPT